MGFATQGGWLSRVLNWGRKRSQQHERAAALYCAVVEAARSKHFYAELGVPDTSDGRLEMIGLFAALAIRRLKREGEPGEEAAQGLFDVMFADIDHNFREQGVGDLSVGKHVKRAASTFLARALSVEQALESGDVEQLAGTIQRNLGSNEPMLEVAKQLFAYDKTLHDYPAAKLLEGSLPARQQRD